MSFKKFPCYHLCIIEITDCYSGPPDLRACSILQCPKKIKLLCPASCQHLQNVEWTHWYCSTQPDQFHQVHARVGSLNNANWTRPQFHFWFSVLYLLKKKLLFFVLLCFVMFCFTSVWYWLILFPCLVAKFSFYVDLFFIKAKSEQV